MRLARYFPCVETTPGRKYYGDGTVKIVTIHKTATTETDERSFFVCASKDAEDGRLTLQVNASSSASLFSLHERNRVLVR